MQDDIDSMHSEDEKGARTDSIDSSYQHEVSTQHQMSQDPAILEKQDPVENHALPTASIETEDYSVFTIGQKRAIILAASFAAFFSPVTGSIYFPALTQIADDLQVSNAEINITVTTYLIIQGLAPMMIAGFSDRAGRRPAYMICFTIYLIANLALSLQDNFVALLILRMLQSAGSSGTVALANGVVGDLITSSERGKFIAWASLGTVLGPSLSPVIGGLISQYLDWHWIFWFLLILSGAFAVPFLLFLPETCRNIVGDGTIPPPWTSRNITDHIRYRNRARNGPPIDPVKLEALRQNYKIQFPNPFDTLKVLVSFEIAPVLLSVGLALAIYYALLTGASEVFSNVYNFNQLDVGLIFLSIGIGSTISAFTTGKMIDWNYRRHARRLNFPIQKNRMTDISDFPIERVRLEIGIPLLLTTAAVVIGYGWMMVHKISLAGPVIMLFICGYCLTAGSQCLTVLMVDIYPGKPAAATAANNIVRCLLGAAASAAIDPMSAAMGYGWSYTVLALIFLISTPGLFVTAKYGIAWRKRARLRQERKQERKASSV